MNRYQSMEIADLEDELSILKANYKELEKKIKTLTMCMDDVLSHEKEIFEISNGVGASISTILKLKQCLEKIKERE